MVGWRSTRRSKMRRRRNSRRHQQYGPARKRHFPSKRKCYCYSVPFFLCVAWPPNRVSHTFRLCRASKSTSFVGIWLGRSRKYTSSTLTSNERPKRTSTTNAELLRFIACTRIPGLRQRWSGYKN